MMDLRKCFFGGWLICVVIACSVSASATRWISVIPRCGSVKFHDDGKTIIISASLAEQGMHILGYQNGLYVNTLRYPYGKTHAALAQRLQNNDCTIPPLMRGSKAHRLESLRWDHVLHRIVQPMTWRASCMYADNVMWSFGPKGSVRVEMPESYVFKTVQWQMPSSQGLFAPSLRFTREDLDGTFTVNQPHQNASHVKILITPGTNYRFKIPCRDDEFLG